MADVLPKRSRTSHSFFQEESLANLRVYFHGITSDGQEFKNDKKNLTGTIVAARSKGSNKRERKLISEGARLDLTIAKASTATCMVKVVRNTISFVIVKITGPHKFFGFILADADIHTRALSALLCSLIVKTHSHFTSKVSWPVQFQSVMRCNQCPKNQNQSTPHRSMHSPRSHTPSPSC